MYCIHVFSYMYWYRYLICLDVHVHAYARVGNTYFLLFIIAVYLKDDVGKILCPKPVCLQYM